MTDPVPRRLVELGVATIHEAAGRRNLIHGLRLLTGEPFAGPAVTVAIPAGDNLGIHLALEQAAPGSVLCVESAGRGLYGVIGELLVEAARQRGIKGLLIDDGIRDLAELFPPPAIAARGVSSQGTTKNRLRRRVGAEIAIGGTLIEDGDWIVCDADGLCVVPGPELDTIIETAEARVAKEAIIRQRLQTGETSRQVFGLSEKHAPSFP